jgi:hypothetical protein
MLRLLLKTCVLVKGSGQKAQQQQFVQLPVPSV